MKGEPFNCTVGSPELMRACVDLCLEQHVWFKVEPVSYTTWELTAAPKATQPLIDLIANWGYGDAKPSRVVPEAGTPDDGPDGI